jgi:ABC-type transporter Mla subunit MlaD
MSDVTNENGDLAEALRTRLEKIEKRMTDLWDRLDRSAGATIDRMKPFLDELERALEAARSMLHKVSESAGEHGRELAQRARAEIDGLDDEVSAAAQELQERLADSRSAFRDAATKELEAWRSRLDRLKERKPLRTAAHEEVEDLRARAEHAYDEAKERIGEVTDEGEESLEIIRSGLGRVLDDVRATIRQLRDREKEAA